MPIIITFEEISQITNLNLVSNIDCSENELISLHAFGTNMNFPNLLEFNCSYNNLTSLPNMNLPNLQIFDCSNNQLTLLPDNMNFPNLLEFNCSSNQLTSLPDN